jgi:hypothetical protein
VVNRVTALINSLPKQNGIHSILSPREIVTGKKFRCPSIQIGQYVQGHTGGTNDTGQERSIDSLYLGRADNSSGHEVYKLSTKQFVSVNQVTEIPTTDGMINIVNNIAEQEAQPEGIEFSDMHGRITLRDFAANNNDDSNASGNDFKLDEECKEEVDNKIALDKEEGSVGNDDLDLQEDYFQNPIQQHNTAVANNNEPVLDIRENRTRSGSNPVVTFTTTTSAKQECGGNKKKKGSIVKEGNAITEEDLEDDPLPLNSTKLGVDGSEYTNTTQDEADSGVPDELKSDLGPYWVLAQ